jgi:O-antigen/teichoic acid export membrane protein
MLRSLSSALLIQSFGVLAVYLAVFATARFGGPEAQGQFTTLKSFIDLANAILLMGLPQAIILVVNRGQTNVRAMTPWLRAYVGVAFLAGLAAALAFAPFVHHDAWDWRQLEVALAIAGFLSFAVTRGALLTRTDGAFFSLFTAMPQLVLLAGVLWVLARGGGFEEAYALQGAICLVASQLVLGSVAARDVKDAPLPPWRALVAENLHAFAQAMLYAAQLFISVRIIRHGGGTLADVGQFGVISLPLLALHAFAGMIGPLYYNRWSKLAEPEPFMKVARSIAGAGIGLQLAALACLPFLALLIGIVFGPAFAPSALPMSIALFAVFPVIMTRLLSPYLQTSGHAAINTLSCALRLMATAIVALVAISAGAGVLVAGAIGWTVAEWLAFLFIAGSLRRNIHRDSARPK